MKIAVNVVLLLLAAWGALWALQGANILGGSGMSGQPGWLFGGIAMIVVCLATLWWFNRRRPMPR